MRILRIILVAACAALFTASAAQAQGSSYPARPIRLVVTLSPGSSSDILARIVAEEMSRSLRQPVVVENRPGAGGNVAGEHVARSAPDGYTLLLASVSSHGINPAIYARMPYDAVRDFTPVSLLASSPNVLVVKGSGERDLAGLIAAAKAAPGQLNYSSGGVGTSHHLSGELLNVLAGVRTEHVPYRGSPEAVTAVQTGEVAFMFPNAPNAIALADAGELRILAVTTPRRVSFLPQVPTMIEAGIPGFDVTAWFGLVAPARTPTEVVSVLNAAAQQALSSDAVRAKLVAQWFEPIGGTSEEFSNFMRQEIERWRGIASSRGISVQ